MDVGIEKVGNCQRNVRLDGTSCIAALFPSGKGAFLYPVIRKVNYWHKSGQSVLALP